MKNMQLFTLIGTLLCITAFELKAMMPESTDLTEIKNDENQSQDGDSLPSLGKRNALKERTENTPPKKTTTGVNLALLEQEFAKTNEELQKCQKECELMGIDLEEKKQSWISKITSFFSKK